MKIESTNSLRTDFWPSYDEIDELNQRVNNVENEVDLLNINVISNDTEIRERISNLQNSYNEQIKTEKLIANQIDVNYASTDFLNSGNINSNNVYIEYLTVNRPVHDAVFNTVHLENATSLNGNFYSPNLIDAHISGNAEINANNINADVVNINYASIDYLKVNLSVEPISSSAVLGYDSDGHLIPIHATYDVGFPSDANYIFTDSFGTAFPGVAADTVSPVNNLIQASAVQNMYNELNESFNNFNNNFNNTLNDFNNSLIDFGNNFNNSLNDLGNNFNNSLNDFANDVNNSFNEVNNFFNNVNNSFNDVNNTIDILANGLENTNANLNELTSLLITNISGWTNSKVPVNIQGITSFEVSRLTPAASGATDIGNGAAMKVDGTTCTLSIPGLFYGKGNCSRLFSYCKLLSSNVEIPKGAVKCDDMFNCCSNLNQNILIPNGVISTSGMFSQCRNLNQNILIPNGVRDCFQMFYLCQNLNQNILIPDSVTNCSNMFCTCGALNQNILIPNGVKDCSGMFAECSNLNQNIQIPNSVTRCKEMFSICGALNQNILIPNSVTSCSQMFGDCRSLNQNILIPASVTLAGYMFDDCINLNQNIYVYSENIGTSCSNMFNNCGLLADKYIHIRSSIPLDTSNKFYNCLVNGRTGIDWTGRVINDLEEPTEWPPL